jgi:hypothetical protein
MLMKAGRVGRCKLHIVDLARATFPALRVPSY